MFTARMSVTLDSGLDSTWRVLSCMVASTDCARYRWEDRLMHHCSSVSPGLSCASRLKDETYTLGF